MSPRTRTLSAARAASSQNFRVVIGVGMLITLCIVIGLFLFSLWHSGWVSDKNILIIPQTIDGSKGKIFLAHISPSEQKVDMAIFPQDYEVSVIGGYGKYPLRSVYPLLQMDKHDHQFLVAAYTFGVGQVIDEVWTTNDASALNASNFPQIMKEVFWGKIKSSLSLGDKIWLYRFVGGLRPDQISTIEVSRPSLWIGQQEKFRFPSTAKDCSLSIVNTTALSGVGTKMAAVLEGSGFSVLRVTDNSDSWENSVIAVAPEQQAACQDVLAHLQNVFPSKVNVEKRAQILNEYRSPIVVFLGKDIGEKLRKDL